MNVTQQFLSNEKNEDVLPANDPSAELRYQLILTSQPLCELKRARVTRILKKCCGVSRMEVSAVPRILKVAYKGDHRASASVLKAVWTEDPWAKWVFC